MLRYGTYIFGGDYSLYVVIDDGAVFGPRAEGVVDLVIGMVW